MKLFGLNFRNIFIDSVLEAKEKGILSKYQRQAITKLIEKNDRYIQRPISLLNVDFKIIFEALSEKLKKCPTQFDILTRNGLC